MTRSTRLYADDVEMYRLFEKELFVAVVGGVMDTLGLQHQFLPQSDKKQAAVATKRIQLTYISVKFCILTSY